MKEILQIQKKKRHYGNNSSMPNSPSSAVKYDKIKMKKTNLRTPPSGASLLQTFVNSGSQIYNDYQQQQFSYIKSMSNQNSPHYLQQQNHFRFPEQQPHQNQHQNRQKYSPSPPLLTQEAQIFKQDQQNISLKNRLAAADLSQISAIQQDDRSNQLIDPSDLSGFDNLLSNNNISQGVNNYSPPQAHNNFSPLQTLGQQKKKQQKAIAIRSTFSLQDPNFKIYDGDIFENIDKERDILPQLGQHGVLMITRDNKVGLFRLQNFKFSPPIHQVNNNNNVTPATVSRKVKVYSQPQQQQQQLNQHFIGRSGSKLTLGKNDPKSQVSSRQRSVEEVKTKQNQQFTAKTTSRKQNIKSPRMQNQMKLKSQILNQNSIDSQENQTAFFSQNIQDSNISNNQRKIQSLKKKPQSPIKKQSALKMFLSKTPSKKKQSATSSVSSMSARGPTQPLSSLSSRKPPRIPNNAQTEILQSHLTNKTTQSDQEQQSPAFYQSSIDTKQVMENSHASQLLTSKSPLVKLQQRKKTTKFLLKQANRAQKQTGTTGKFIRTTSNNSNNSGSQHQRGYQQPVQQKKAFNSQSTTNKYLSDQFQRQTLTNQIYHENSLNNNFLDSEESQQQGLNSLAGLSERQEFQEQHHQQHISEPVFNFKGKEFSLGNQKQFEDMKLHQTYSRDDQEEEQSKIRLNKTVRVQKKMTLEQQLLAKVMKQVNLGGKKEKNDKLEKGLVEQGRKKSQQTSPQKKGTMKFLKLNNRKKNN